MQEIDQEKFGELIDSGKPFVLDFYSPYCSACRATTESLEKLEGEVDVPFYKLDVGKNVELCDKLGIEAGSEGSLFQEQGRFRLPERDGRGEDAEGEDWRGSRRGKHERRE